MKLIYRYLLREYLAPLTYCLLGFSMIYVIYDLFDHMSKFAAAKCSAIQIATYYGCLLAVSMEYLVPASLMLATLYTLWRLTRHHELIAMRASGISLTRIMMPFLAVALIFSVASLAIKELVTPRALEWATLFNDNACVIPESRVQFNVAYYNSRDGRQWYITAMDLNTPGVLGDPIVTIERPDRTKAEIIKAKKARYLDGSWWFFRGFRQAYNEEGGVEGEPSPLHRHGTELRFLTETPEQLISDRKTHELRSTQEMLSFLRSHELSKPERARLTTTLQARIALPWACLIVTLFAIPAGIQSGRQNPLEGVFLALGLFLGFYALTHVGIFLSKKAILWPWLGAWLSNIVFFTTGLVMLGKVK